MHLDRHVCSATPELTSTGVLFPTSLNKPSAHLHSNFSKQVAPERFEMGIPVISHDSSKYQPQLWSAKPRYNWKTPPAQRQFSHAANHRSHFRTTLSADSLFVDKRGLFFFHLRVCLCVFKATWRQSSPMALGEIPEQHHFLFW